MEWTIITVFALIVAVIWIGDWINNGCRIINLLELYREIRRLS